MKALSIKQPWLHAILHLEKDLENRKWKPPKDVIGQRIALHASKQDDDEGYEVIQKISGVILKPEDIQRGCIIATAVLDGVVESSMSPWFDGPFGWILRDIKILNQPVNCIGALGLWNIPDNLINKANRDKN